MILQRLVMLAALAQVVLDGCGLVLVLRPVVWGSTQGKAPASPAVRDYSAELAAYRTSYSAYVLPHLFSGVVARMLQGFPCVTAEQAVIELVAEWEEAVGEPVEHVLGEGEDVEVTEVEEVVIVTQWRKVERISIPDPANSTWEIEVRLDEALKLRTVECGAGGESRDPLELALLAANILSAVLLILVSMLGQCPRLHLPWMVLTSGEIAGNFLVGLAFSIVPGPALVITCVCICRVCWLRWVWANLVRTQMKEQINKEPTLESSQGSMDLERQCLKKVHGERVGRIRLSRVMGRSS